MHPIIQLSLLAEIINLLKNNITFTNEDLLLMQLADKNKEIICLKNALRKANRMANKNINNINNIFEYALGGIWEVNFPENIIIFDENAKNLIGITSAGFTCHLKEIKTILHPEDFISIERKIKLIKCSGLISHVIRFINLTDYKVIIQGRVFCNKKNEVRKAVGICLLNIEST